MMRRAAAAALVGAVAWLAMAAPVAASAQAPAGGPATDAGAVVVDLSGEIEATVDEGVLTRTATASLAPMMAVYVGLGVLGGTLALITTRRRVLTRRARELATGVASGRRRRSDFWDVPAPAAGAPAPSLRRPAPTLRRPARSGLRALVASADATAVNGHRPPVRTGGVTGANQG